VVAAIKTARLLRLGEDDVILTIATDGSEMYRTEAARVLARDFGGELTERDAARIVGEHLRATGPAVAVELTGADRMRIFNLGYFTWVEQRGIPVGDFMVRAQPGFWKGMSAAIQAWDVAIKRLNDEADVSS
jgi:hypothetical protein